MAEDSIVLLKNDGILPLAKNTKVAVIGPNADSVAALIGNYSGTPSKPYTILRGIQEYTNPLYARGCHLYRRNDGSWTSWGAKQYIEEAVAACRNSDVAVMCMGLTAEIEGEEMDDYNGYSSGGDKLTLEFPEPQRLLYEEIKKLGKPIIFVNVSGSCLNLSKPKKECAALIQCFYPGEMGGLALADILYGKVSPSGRLPVTFYESCDDLPEFTDYSMENRTYKFYKVLPFTGSVTVLRTPTFPKIGLTRTRLRLRTTEISTQATAF